mgnify:CR=1 FL=1
MASYDGSKFFGFQTQHGAVNTVMESFKRALSKCGIFHKPLYAGRTDAGVHARGQVVSAVRDVAHKLLDALRTVAEMLAETMRRIAFGESVSSMYVD